MKRPAGRTGCVVATSTAGNLERAAQDAAGVDHQKSAAAQPQSVMQHDHQVAFAARWPLSVKQFGTVYAR